MGLVVVMTLVGHGCSGPDADPLLEKSPPLPSSTSEALTATSTCNGDDGARSPTTATLGSTGHIEIEDFFVGGVFFANSTILRAKANPECVAHLWAAEQRFSNAGTMTVTSDLVGKPGGPSAPLVIYPDDHQEYYEFPDPPLFNFPDGAKVQFELTGATGFPPLRTSTLRSSIFDTITVTAPTLPESDELIVSSTKPLDFAWDAPAKPPHPGLAGHTQQLSVRFFALGPVAWAFLYCSWPIYEGRGQLPAVLLSAVRARLGGSGTLDAVLDVYTGELREFVTAKSSYVVFATTDNAATFPRSTSVLFE